MQTTWYVLAKQVGDLTYFRDSEGLATLKEENAETFPMSDSLREIALDEGYLPVPADFFGIEV